MLCWHVAQIGSSLWVKAIDGADRGRVSNQELASNLLKQFWPLNGKSRVSSSCSQAEAPCQRLHWVIKRHAFVTVRLHHEYVRQISL